jgi:hypothetical protein
MRPSRFRRFGRTVVGCRSILAVLFNAQGGRAAAHLAVRAVATSDADAQGTIPNCVIRAPDRSVPRWRPSRKRFFAGPGVTLLALVVTTVFAAAPSASGLNVPGRGTSCANFGGPFPQGPYSLSGCSDVANTGKSGSLDDRTGVITWATGKTTTVSYALTPIENEQGEKHQCPATAAAEFKLRGTVTADSTGSIEVRGPVIGRVCARENGILTNARGTRLKIL